MERGLRTASWLRWAALAAVLSVLAFGWMTRGPGTPSGPAASRDAPEGAEFGRQRAAEEAGQARSEARANAPAGLRASATDERRDAGLPASGSGSQAGGPSAERRAALRGGNPGAGSAPATAETATERPTPWFGGGRTSRAVAGVTDAAAGSAGPQVEDDAAAGEEDAAFDEQLDEQADDELIGQEETLFAPADLVLLEDEAAYAAEYLELLSAEELEFRIDERVKFVPEGHPLMGRAREAARRVVLADAALVEDLVRARYPDNAESRQEAQARAWLEALLPTWDDEYRVERLTGIAERLER